MGAAICLSLTALDDHWANVEALLAKYAHRPIALADACLIRVAELHQDARIVTFDADFDVYRSEAEPQVPPARSKAPLKRTRGRLDEQAGDRARRRIGRTGYRPAGRIATARSGAPLPPPIFIGSATMAAPVTGSWSSAVRFSNAGMLRSYSTRCDSKSDEGP